MVVPRGAAGFRAALLLAALCGAAALARFELASEPYSAPDSPATLEDDAFSDASPFFGDGAPALAGVFLVELRLAFEIPRWKPAGIAPRGTPLLSPISRAPPSRA